MSKESTGRRAHFTLALALLASVPALQAWHVVMPEAAWLAAQKPAKPTLTDLQAGIANEWHALLSLRWVNGVSEVSGLVLWLGLPATMISLLVHAQHPVIPAFSRRLAWAAFAGWLATVLVYVGLGLAQWWSDAPLWFWLVLLVALPLQFRSAHSNLALAVWGLSLAIVIVKALAWLVSPMWLRDVLFAAALLATVICWVVWYARMEAVATFDGVLAASREFTRAAEDANDLAQDAVFHRVAPPQDFDLIEHLDSPQAQEGADKYTRE